MVPRRDASDHASLYNWKQLKFTPVVPQRSNLRLKAARISMQSFAHNNEDRVTPVDLKDMLSSKAKQRMLKPSALGSVAAPSIPCMCLAVTVLGLTHQASAMRANFAYLSRGSAKHPKNEDRVLAPVEMSHMLTLRAKERLLCRSAAG